MGLEWHEGELMIAFVCVCVCVCGMWTVPLNIPAWKDASLSINICFFPAIKMFKTQVEKINFNF